MCFPELGVAIIISSKPQEGTLFLKNFGAISFSISIADSSSRRRRGRSPVFN
jgi:hypothetical protein